MEKEDRLRKGAEVSGKKCPVVGGEGDAGDEFGPEAEGQGECRYDYSDDGCDDEVGAEGVVRHDVGYDSLITAAPEVVSG